MTLLTFVDAGNSTSGKTRRWYVQNGTGTRVLGHVQWFAAWRRYVFYPLAETLFDAACLGELRTFLLDETTTHKAAKR